jgi:hypothetical protein
VGLARFGIIDVAALAKKFANARTCGRPAGLELRRMPLLRPPERQVDRRSGSCSIPIPSAATAPPYPKETAKPEMPNAVRILRRGKVLKITLDRPPANASPRACGASAASRLLAHRLT